MRLHRLRAADLAAVDGDDRVVAHVLRLERRHRHAVPREPPADPGDERALARVRGRAGHQQRAAQDPLGQSVHRDYRRHVRFLLRPGWLAFIALVVGFAVICYTLLAPWQFGREEQRQAQERAIAAANAAPPVPLAELAPAGTAVGSDVEWRRVTATGTYLPESEAVVRLRVVDGKPAVEVLTPLRLDDGRIVAVDRGLGRRGERPADPRLPGAADRHRHRHRPAARRRGRPRRTGRWSAGTGRRSSTPSTPARSGRRSGSTSRPGTCSWRTARPGCSARCR